MPIPIVVPYTKVKLEKETRAVGEALGAIFVELVGDEDYFDLLEEYWMLGQGIIVIEHDMVPTVEQIQALQKCPEPWCAWPYEYLGTDKEGSGRVVYPGGGCCKYGPQLMAHREVMARVGVRYDDHPPKHWCRLDEHIMWELMAEGFVRHAHEGQVRHLHPNVSHNCVIVNPDLTFTRILKPYVPVPTPSDPELTKRPGAPTEYH